METRVKIKTWPQFAKKVRRKNIALLGKLDRFPQSILVAGCQRSGTTMLARIITQSEGMVNYWFGKDDELDAALILSGSVVHEPRGRYCFQTTYLNDNYKEYFDHLKSSYRLIWMLRNPYSVVYSMVYHWRSWALNELFESCGAAFLEGNHLRRYQRFGAIAVPKILKACLSYKGKSLQLVDISKNVDARQLMVLDYDDLIQGKKDILKRVYDFIDLSFKEQYLQHINSKSINKSKKLKVKERQLVEQIALPVYEKLKMSAQA